MPKHVSNTSRISFVSAMSSSIKICILVPSILGGGAEDSMLQLVEYFRSKDLRTKLIGINFYPDPRATIDQDLICLGRKSNDGLIQTCRIISRLRKLVAMFAPDYLIVNCELAELCAVFLPSTHLIVVEHTTRPWGRRRPIGVIVRTALSLRRAKWITVNRSQQSIWPFGLPCLYIPNPVRYCPAESDSQSRVVFVGRLISSKHPELIVRLARDIGTKAVIVGDGNLMNSLRNSSDGLNVEFKGFQVNPWSEIGSDELLIVPSEFEGDGKIVVEAILRGNPLLLADNPDLRRFCLDEKFYFSNYEDLKGKALAYLSQGPKTFRAPSKLRKKLLLERNLAQVGSRWFQLFN
jgi:glycosyltransferase involved in cell wall biosynthesis